MVISYQRVAGAVATIVRNMFPLLSYKDALTCRLKVDKKVKSRDLRQPVEGSKKLLIYAVNMHPRNILSPTTCTTKNSPRDMAVWLASILPQLDNYPDTEKVQTYTQQAHMDLDKT